jgi:hypothetical protein
LKRVATRGIRQVKELHRTNLLPTQLVLEQMLADFRTAATDADRASARR